MYWTIDNELDWLNWIINEYTDLLKVPSPNTPTYLIHKRATMLTHFLTLRTKLKPEVEAWHIYLRTGVYNEFI